jgi:hypothetical protein
MNQTLNPLSAPPLKPWYREPWPWFLISLPASAVIAGVATVWIAVQSADGLVVGDYYKAGLAINQTLARDDAARALALAATLNNAQGALTLTLTGRLRVYPQQLTLQLSHPTHQGMDQSLTFSHLGSGHYRAARPAMPDGKWNAQLTDSTSAWRLSGVLYTPFDQPATLAAADAIDHQPQGD